MLCNLIQFHERKREEKIHSICIMKVELTFWKCFQWMAAVDYNVACRKFLANYKVEKMLQMQNGRVFFCDLCILYCSFIVVRVERHRPCSTEASSCRNEGAMKSFNSEIPSFW